MSPVIINSTKVWLRIFPLGGMAMHFWNPFITVTENQQTSLSSGRILVMYLIYFETFCHTFLGKEIVLLFSQGLPQCFRINWIITIRDMFWVAK